MATTAEIQIRIQALQNQLEELNSRLIRAIQANDTALINQLQAQIDIDRGELTNLFNQVALPTASAGEVVNEAARARDDNAYSSNPVAAATTLEVSTRITAAQVETGTNAPVRNLEQTQSVPPPGNGAPLVYLNEYGDQYTPLPGNGAQLLDRNEYGDQYTPLPGFVTTQGGVGALGDDSGISNKNSTRAEIDNMFNQDRIVPQNNILDQYASYTYQFSLYLMKPEGYRQLMNSRKKIISNSQLLIQSGGIPAGNRNTYFPNDYYIENVQLRSAITGKGTNAAHNVNQIKMTVVEPNGITLIPNLSKAVEAFLGGAQNKRVNFASAIYLLVIRFYGYDDQGNLVQGGVNSPLSGTTGPAFVEKYYPITIDKIDFKVSNKLVEYDIQGTAVQQSIATGSNRGTIPYNVELGGISVKDALTGPTVVTPPRSATAPPNERDSTQSATPTAGVDANPPPAPPNVTAANKANTQTVRQGLVTALNQFQQNLVKQGIYSVADTYSVEFIGNSISDARIQVKNPDKNQLTMSVAKTAADAKDPAKQSNDPNSRMLSVLAGTQIVQFIDKLLKNSTYVTDQALVKVSEQNGKQTPNGSPGKNVAAYKITTEALPIKYDPKRNDYAYAIKYVISPYQVQNLISPYFQIPKYRGVHKQYNYWFTGENTQVLSYEQTYNALYSAVMSGTPGQLGGTLIQDAIKANFQPRSNESSQGATGRTNEIGASFTDALYNPGDLANATMQIVGDPAWLQQGEVVNVPNANNFSTTPFNPDGSINFEAGQILFEILINTPGDYNLNTGLIDPNRRETVFQTQLPGSNRQSYVYVTNECISDFNKGKFTQTLKGTLLTYLPDQGFKQIQTGARDPSTLTGASSRSSTNPGIEKDPNWTDQNGTYVLNEDLPTDLIETDDPISLNTLLPESAPELPTSDADINPYEEQSELVQPGVNSDSQLMDKEA
jgi:hypothetical protein